jgi:hypothetical protein
MSPPVVPGSDVLEAVREDPDLVPMEKETTFRFAKDQDRADVFTSERGLTRRLLTFPPFDLRTVTLADGSRSRTVRGSIAYNQLTRARTQSSGSGDGSRLGV